MDALLTLVVTFMLQGSKLVVSYSVTNHSPQVVYLTNHASRIEPGKGAVPDRSVALVYFENGDVVHVTKRNPPAPSDRFYTPRPHYVTPLPPKDKFTESFALPLPLKEYIPYQSVKAGGKQGLAHEIYFSIGYIVKKASIEAVELQRAGEKVYLIRSTLKKEENPPDRPVEPVVENFLVSERFKMEIPLILPVKEQR